MSRYDLLPEAVPDLPKVRRVIWSSPPAPPTYTVWWGVREGTARGIIFRWKWTELLVARWKANRYFTADVWVEEEEGSEHA